MSNYCQDCGEYCGHSAWSYCSCRSATARDTYLQHSRDDDAYGLLHISPPVFNPLPPPMPGFHNPNPLPPGL